MAEKQVVIAIDYGTAASGYAWAFADATNGDRGKIKNIGNLKFYARYMGEGGKDLSVIATDSQGQLIPYGKLEPGETRERNRIGREVFALDPTDCFIHKRVKMDLYDPESNKIEGIKVTGNADPAEIYRELRGQKFYTLDLIAEALRELSQRALNEIKNCSGATYFPKDALWVITVPANATQLQKDAMREAARRAGLVDSIEADNLILAFEPEVAAIRIHCDDACRERFKKYAKDGKYITLIVDAGGGTVDSTAFLCDFNNQNRLVEAGYSRASNAGSTYIDKAVFDYLATEIFPKLHWAQCQSQDREAFSLFLREIVVQKELFPVYDELRIDVSAPVNYCNEKDIPYNKNNIRHNRFYMPQETFVGFVRKQFDNAIDSIVELVRNVKTNYPGVPICYTIVGGLGCSSIYRQMVVERLELEDAKYVDLYCDNMRKSSVLAGAVLYGDDPTMIDRRYCKYTFGTSCLWDFDPKRHQGRKIYTDYQGNKHAENGFNPLIKKGDELKNGRFDYVEQWRIRLQRKPDCGEIVEAQVPLYEIQDSEIPEFLDDTEKKKEIASYKFNITCNSNGEARYVLSFTADKTEMKIKATDCSNDKVVLDEPVRYSANMWQLGR